VVIADLTMPKITGRRLAEKIKQIRSDLPIILTTGMAWESGAMKERFKHFAALPSKPVLYGDLAKILRKVLDRSKD
jgi:DNA-binding NtrC family response regulator